MDNIQGILTLTDYGFPLVVSYGAQSYADLVSQPGTVIETGEYKLKNGYRPNYKWTRVKGSWGVFEHTKPLD